MEALTALGMTVHIYRRPTEVESQTPFDIDEGHRAYDAEYAHRCWRILVSAADVFGRFRSRFFGKASPVHFFRGAFDIAFTPFSSCTAPPHPVGIPILADQVPRVAYSQRVSSCAFWPGGAPAPYPLFCSYAYP